MIIKASNDLGKAPANPMYNTDDRCEKHNCQCDLRKHGTPDLMPHRCAVSGCKSELLGLLTEKLESHIWTTNTPQIHKVKYDFCELRSERKSTFGLTDARREDTNIGEKSP